MLVARATITLMTRYVAFCVFRNFYSVSMIGLIADFYCGLWFWSDNMDNIRYTSIYLIILLYRCISYLNNKINIFRNDVKSISDNCIDEISMSVQSNLTSWLYIHETF